MNPFKSLFITLSILALFAANAAAQCKGKTVYLQVPDGWNKTTIYILWEGNIITATATVSGAWSKFTFPTPSNDATNKYFALSMKGTEIDAGNKWIAKDKYNVTGSRPDLNGNTPQAGSAGSGLSCGTDKVVYIYPNPSNPSATVYAGTPPNAKVFYFYPPSEEKWISGKSYITNKPSDPSSAKLMSVDPNMCGWYRVVYFNETPPDYVQIWLGANGIDKIGSNGRQDDFDPTPTVQQLGVIELSDKFNTVGDTLYFVADDGYADGWSKTDPGISDSDRCKYNLAAFIYDTDPSVHPDFSCGVYQNEDNCTETPTNQNKKSSCVGVKKGLVKKTLNTTTRKIECDRCTIDQCWTSAAKFSEAFTATKGVNVQHCYDMPFSQAANGRYEFDSDKMLNANKQLVGGFFPKILNDAKPTDAAYADCRNCATKRTAESFAPLDEKKMTDSAYRDYNTAANDFRDGDHPDIWDWGARDKLEWYLHGNTKMLGSNKGLANEFFCFESHAKFIYDPEQVFYFTGDDDIWVFINDTLVVDLGGAHMAAPGHVRLRDIGGSRKMTAGNPYPIDIFFCDRRSTQSNVRISTNMYVVQNSSFYKKLVKEEDKLCASISGANDCAAKMGVGGAEGELCGTALINAGYAVEFYMVRRGSTDTTWLSNKNTKDCTGTSPNDFACFGGIKVKNAVYSCGGWGECKGHPEAIAKVNVSGNFNVYARLVKDGTPLKSLQIDQFKSETNTRIVWGNLTSMNNRAIKKELKDAYGATTSQTQNIIAGKRTPIYIASGSWNASRTFDYDDEDAGGTAYSVTIVGGTGLTIYDKFGEEKSSGNLPKDGIDTLWVEGGYSIGGKEFSLNVVAENATSAPSLKVVVYQPELRFTGKDFDGNAPLTPRGYKQWGESVPFVGIGLEVNLVAWDGKKKALCDHCAFSIKGTSTSNNGDINAIWDNAIVGDDASKLTGGKATFYIYGQDKVLSPDLASWRITGPSGEITAEWTELQFRFAPVPFPLNSAIFDRNGDGFGDSLRIEFNKSFRGDSGTVIRDSLLLILLEVIWENGDTVRYHHPDYKVSDLKNLSYVRNLYDKGSSGFFAENGKYWKKYVKGDTLSILAFEDKEFSTKVATAGYNSGKGIILSYTPFYDTGVFSYSTEGQRTAINDSIPPIVVKAEYTGDKKASCFDKKEPGCRETLVAYLSEPVFAAKSDIPSLIKNPFSYCLRSQPNSNCPATVDEEQERHNQKYNNLDWGWEVAGVPNEEDTSYSATYKPANSKKPNLMTEYAQGVTNGDSIAELIYYAYKVDADYKTRMPKGDDWIKIRPPSSVSGGQDVFRDAAGNFANPREIGVLITGINYYTKTPVKIAEVKPDPKAPPIGGVLTGEGEKPWWLNDLSKGYADSLFNYGSVTEFLPIPKDRSFADTAKFYYPGSVGTIFDVADNLTNEVSKFRTECEKANRNICTTLEGKNLSQATDAEIAKNITLHASVHYHTNLGNYTAHRDPIVARCDSEIFKSASGDGDCLSNKYNFYLAWDLKTNNGRFIGAGAYVAITKFHWQLEYMVGTARKVSKFNQDDFIDLFGARRGAVVKK
ncbi:fibro-slime domain protein [Fibrobacteria bacterium R8-3-H12]